MPARAWCSCARHSNAACSAQVAADTNALPFADTGIDGLTQLALSDDPGHPHASAPFRMAPSGMAPHHNHTGGEGMLILVRECLFSKVQ